MEFTTIGTTTWTAPATATSVTCLVVGGGGSGGGAFDNSAGGGGAGLVRTATMNVTPGQTYNVTVGAGGAGAVRPTYSNPRGSLSSNNMGSAPGGSGIVIISFNT